MATAPRPADLAEIVRLNSRVDELERLLERQQSELAQSAAAILKDIIHLTTSIFGEEVTVHESCDPDFPSQCYVVFTVSTRMEIAEAMQAEQQWARSIKETCPCLDSIRLLISPA